MGGYHFSLARVRVPFYGLLVDLDAEARLGWKRLPNGKNSDRMLMLMGGDGTRPGLQRKSGEPAGHIAYLNAKEMRKFALEEIKYYAELATRVGIRK
ncbi:MAG: hypothetical protein HY882_15455 [Deltaproteobacteria bacterium]|nr:hypothetical protein [Deltaproteobacteria bacterium]